MKFFFKLFESDTEEETNDCRSSLTCSALKFLNITALMVCTLLHDTLFP